MNVVSQRIIVVRSNIEGQRLANKNIRVNAQKRIVVSHARQGMIFADAIFDWINESLVAVFDAREYEANEIVDSIFFKEVFGGLTKGWDTVRFNGQVHDEIARAKRQDG